MVDMMKLLADLTPLNRVICSSDFDDTIGYMKDILPFREWTYPADDVYNGWVIPPKWDVKQAGIYHKGRLIYDGLHHPLAVMALSAPFRGTVDLAELKQHLHYDHRYDGAIPFHFRQLFRSYDRDWGFCVPKTFYDGLAAGNYDIVIETEEAPGILRVLDFTIEGKVPETIVFGANLDHPGVANDGLSGVAVGVALFDRLRQMKEKPNFSYRLVLAPGIIGNEYYLGMLPVEERDKIIEGMMLEMLGSPTELSLQLSRSKNSNIELSAEDALDELRTRHNVGEFESSLINDEYIWEAYGIPMASLSRYPYPEYHTDRDDIGLMSNVSLEESLDVVSHAVNTLESGPIIRKKFIGNICLSNPAYDLYIDPGQVAFGDKPDGNRRKLRLLMDIIPTITRPVTITQLAKKVGLPDEEVERYIRMWGECDLVSIT
ncbi:aminopeptidase-like domain-containing protein [Aidingimonas halophila]|uniref:Aminopeptidase-like domain-containing protein n=4 Tax=Aidingimonas halophila TaxID=574349 RepID=A0A1H3CGR8_9GAMM|nr:peptidase M28 [Aidingimonas halophila]SDX53210.1 aminopeptidase-like domain-containing protein [Aidingimonas halophila]